MMHFYRFVRCKTPTCLCKWYIAHQEFPAAAEFIRYPEEWFPIEVECARCQQKSEYGIKEIQSETTHRRLHPPGWQPLLPDTPAPERVN